MADHIFICMQEVERVYMISVKLSKAKTKHLSPSTDEQTNNVFYLVPNQS